MTGTGLIDVTSDHPAVGELAAVGVLTAFRRRGIASALSAHLARTAHAQDISLVFDEEIAAGRGTVHESAEEMFAHLDVLGAADA